MTASACPCESCRDPQVVTNQPGLETIAYRVDEFTGFRRALLRPRPGEQALFGWHPAPGDLGLQLLEWWAYLADILTFYNERIANEDYLRTAEASADVTRIVSLLGYRPRPAIGAVGKVAARRSISRPLEPLLIPAGFQLANSATPGVPVETFEAAAASFDGPSDDRVVARPSPNLLQPKRPGEGGFGAVLLRGSVSGIAPGDSLLLLAKGDQTAEHDWTKVHVLSTAVEPGPDKAPHTRVALAGDDADAAWAKTAKAADARLMRWTQTAALWNQTSAAAISDEGDGLKVRLNAAVRGIGPDDLVFLDRGAHGYAVGRVTRVSDEFLGVPYPNPSAVKPPPPDIPILHTVLHLETPTQTEGLLQIEETPVVHGSSKVKAAHKLGSAPSTVLRHGLKNVGRPIAAPVTTLTSLPAHVTPAKGLEIPAGGAQAFLEDADGTGISVIATTAADGSITLSASDSTPATFSLAAPFRLLVDLLDVSRGKSVSGELLGRGDASVGGQTFTLKNSPLTYLASGAGWASTLSIAVDGILWREVETFYDEPRDARVFVVNQSPDATSVVRFGDGENGARLPTGSNVVATYRYGAGAASPPAGRLTTILKPQPNLRSIRNPVAVWGGADAQQPGEIRKNAPASVLTFGRAISGEDYETVAAQAPGVGRARAYWAWDAGHQRALVKVFVGDDAGAATAARTALAGAEDPNRPVAVAQATPVELALTCTLAISPDHIAGPVTDAATAALTDPETGLFSAARMGIGRTLYSSELEAALLVPGAEAVHALSVTAAGADVFASEPVGWANPGEGAFYVLTSTTITPQVADA